MKYKLGIVIPVYKSTRSVVELVADINDALAEVAYHVYLVDDSGDDDHLSWMVQNCVTPQVTLIVLRHSSGQQNAILCGLRAAIEQCDTVATMDDDLQHPAALLPRIYHKLEQGYDMVYAISLGGKKPLYRRIGSLGRDILFGLLLHIPHGIHVSSFRIMSGELARKASVHSSKFYYLTASALKSTPKGAMKIANLYYPATERPYGKSGYCFRKLFAIYIGILRTYTQMGKALLHPEQGTGYEISEIVEGSEVN